MACLVPLQVHTDSQITVRSDFSSMEEFIQLVTESFLHNAPAGSKLIFKVHPMDRGYRDYRQFIKSLQARPDVQFSQQPAQPRGPNVCSPKTPR